jgi:hypothetical protein
LHEFHHFKTCFGIPAGLYPLEEKKVRNHNFKAKHFIYISFATQFSFPPQPSSTETSESRYQVCYELRRGRKSFSNLKKSKSIKLMDVQKPQTTGGSVFHMY